MLDTIVGGLVGVEESQFLLERISFSIIYENATPKENSWSNISQLLKILFQILLICIRR
jgi:hypothetical protein